MASTQDHEIDDKDEKSSRSVRDDEDNAIASKEPQDVEKSAPQNEEKPEATEPSKNSDPGPPNGGFKAWLQVVGSFMLFFNTFGLLNTFGVYQTYYESGQLWHASSSNISWIGAIQSTMVLLSGLITGPIFDRGYLTALIAVGTFLIVFGHMMLSLTHNFWQALLAQGFTIGFGAGCLYIPSIAIMPTYFTTNIGLAIGLAASGSSMGGIIYPIMFYKLIPQVGYPWSVRIIGFTSLATLLIPLAIMRIRVKPGKIRKIIDWSAFVDFPYMFFAIGCVIGFIGLYVALFYTSYYGQANHITDESLSFYLVPILNAGSVFGRTLPNWLSDKIGPLNVLVPGALSVGILLLCYLAATNVGGLVVCTLLFGFASGIFIALPPVLFAALTKDKSLVGTRMGMGFAMISVGVLSGGPGAGSILGTGTTNLDWTGTWVYGGVAALVAGTIFTILRIMKGGFRLMVKV